ncbi:protein of unknown function (plasmid) [Methylocella tundrae]|uniref:Thiolase N-terminal domain-containing protein n=1 Tax=Methylocella tundrae TaxID=227605 RepID=A0A4V6INF6_METTU|nr:protein of unknown function [Methylocella tundrae]
MTKAVVAGYARSPFTLAKKGDLASVRPDELAAQVIRALVAKSGVAAGDIEDLLLGCAFPEGEQGLNLARLVSLLAGLPNSLGAATINRFCGSSMSSVHIAAGAIKMEAGEAFIAAGVESMSRVPIMGFNPPATPRLGRSHARRLYQHGRHGRERRRQMANRPPRTGGVLPAFAAARRGGARGRQVRGRDHTDHRQEGRGDAGRLHPP